MTTLSPSLREQLARQMVQVCIRQSLRAMQAVVDDYGDLLPDSALAAIQDWSKSTGRLNSALEAE